MLIFTAENIFTTNGFVKKVTLLLSIFLLLLAIPMMAKAEIVNNPLEKEQNSAQIQANKAGQEEVSKKNWRVINDASFQISPAPPALRAEGETLQQLGFDDIDTLLASIEKKTAYSSVAFSPDGRFIASGSFDNSVKLWDIQNQKLAHTFEGHSSSVYSVAFSPDGRFIASGSDDNSVKLWDIQNQKLAHTFEGHYSNVNSVAFSPDGRFIASGAGDYFRRSSKDNNVVKLWDIQNQKLVHTFEGHYSLVNSVAFSPDGRFIASGSWDNTVKLWDIQNQKLAHTFEGHSSDVRSVAFSPDRRFIASGSNDNTVKLWDIQNQKLAHTFEGHSRYVYSVAYSPDGRFIASGSDDNTVKLWDIQNQKLAHSFEGHSSRVNSVAFSSDGRFIASGSLDETIKLWDIQNQKRTHNFEGHSGRVTSLTFSPDNRFIATGSNDNAVKLWDIQNQILAHTFEVPLDSVRSGSVTSVAFSSDGHFMVSGYSDNTVKLWDIQNQKLAHTFDGHSSRVSSVAFSPDHRFIVSGYSDNTVKLWDIQNQKLAHTFEGHSSGVNSVAFSPNGRFITSGSNDNTVKLWDIQNQKLAHSFEGHSGRVDSVVFSPDSRFIASGSNDNTVKLWDIQNQKLAQTLEGHSGEVGSVAFSPNGRFITSGSTDKTVKLWDIQNQTVVHSFEGHSSYVYSVTFSPDGRFIASGSWDNTVKLWDMQNLSNETTLISLRVDTWLLIKNNDLVFRGEHGNLLRKKADNNDWLSVFPTDMKLESNLSISIPPGDFSILTGQGTEAELKVDIRNTGSEAAFWLKLKPAQSEDGIVRLDAPDNRLKPKGQSFWKASHITRLEAGETATIHARISTNLKFPADFVLPGIRPLTVTVVSANGTEVSQTINVDVQLPRLEWKKASLEADGSSLKVELQNTGNAVFAEGFVQLLTKGLNEIAEGDILTPKQTITELEPGQSIELAFILPKLADLSYLFKILFNPELLQLQGQSNQLPVFAWNLTTQWINWLALWLIAFVLPLTTFAIVYLRRYRHPLLVELSDNPERLLLIQPERLPEARSRLQKTKRLETVLSKSNVTSRTLENGIAFFAVDSSEQKIQHLEIRLGTQAVKIQDKLWKLQLPQNFPLNLQHCLVYFPQKKTAADDVFTDLKAIPEISRSTTLLIGKDSDYQRQLYTKSKDPSNKFVAPSGSELTQLLLSPEPEIVLAEILAGQLALTLLSPYQLGGGVNNKSVFFGRQDIIDHILNREPANYLLAGGRQLGKSSLLKALERRFQDQGDVICFYLALASEVLIPRLISLLKLPKGSDINALAEYAEKSDKRLVFLIDEADKFIATERQHDYKILNTLRQMSEEGRCFFILAGFWELYQHAILDYQSPLKNFAETIQIGALEDEACRLLATEPMKTMRLEYADSTLIEGLLENTGGRANLITIVCHQIIEHLGSNQRIINSEDVQRAINSEKTLNALRGWGAMTDDQQACRLDRIIVYTTVELDRFTLDQLLDMLKQHQIKLNMEMIEQSLARLELGFVLGREQKRQYKYQVPLFQEMIINESPVAKLSIEIDDWNAAQNV